MNLNLTRPIVFFDLETTGLNPSHDKIVQISILKVNVDGKEIQKTWLVNPGIHIPEETTAVHGITDEMVKDKPSFLQIASEVMNFIGKADIAGYNIIKFDLPMLAEEMIRAGVDFDVTDRNLMDVMNIYMKMEPRNLSAAYRFFTGKQLDDAHSADADTRATYDVLCAMLDHYKDAEVKDKNGIVSKPIVNNMKALADFSLHHKNVDLSGQIVYDDKGVAVFNFGKHKGKSVVDVFKREPQYYDWMMNSDFPEYTKKIITKIKMSLKFKTTLF